MFEQWKLDFIRFFSSLDPIVFSAIIVLLTLCIIVLVRFIVKSVYNVPEYKKKIVMPIILIAVLTTCIILFCLARY